jgi:hypothetical protein
LSIGQHTSISRRSVLGIECSEYEGIDTTLHSDNIEVLDRHGATHSFIMKLFLLAMLAAAATICQAAIPWPPNENQWQTYWCESDAPLGTNLTYADGLIYSAPLPDGASKVHFQLFREQSI